MNGFEFGRGSIRACSNHESDHSAMNEFMDHPTDHHLSINSAPSLASSSDGASRYNFENVNFSYAVFKYINDILMEEDVASNTCMLQDCLALQALKNPSMMFLASNIRHLLTSILIVSIQMATARMMTSIVVAVLITTIAVMLLTTHQMKR